MCLCAKGNAHREVAVKAKNDRAEALAFADLGSKNCPKGKTQMKRYLVDFTFEASDERIYWLPLGFLASDGRKARQVAERIEHGLQEKFAVERVGPYAAGTYQGDLLLELRRGRRKGEPAFLNLVEHTFRRVEFNPQLSFDEHLSIALLEADEPFPDDPAVIASIRNFRIPVRLVGEGNFEGLHSLLVINVISPDVPDQPRSIPAESVPLGSVEGRYFRATIYETPHNEIAVLVDISNTARQLQLDTDRMNVRIWDKSIELTGDYPDFYVTRRVKL